MDKAEIRALLMRELESRVDGAVEALAKFAEEPGALTFRDAENVTHAQITQALDAAVGQVAQAAAAKAEVDGAGKKTGGAMGGGKSPSN